MSQLLKSRRANRIPGDQDRVLMSEAVDQAGKVWPIGTVFVPHCAGHDNECGKDYQEVRIAGKSVVFLGRR